MPVGATCSVAVARAHPRRRWLTGMRMALIIPRLDHRDNSNNHSHNPNCSGNGNNTNIGRHVKVLTMAPRTVSPNADNAHWRGIEHGRMISITLVGSVNGMPTRLVVCQSSIAACFFFFSSSQPSHSHPPVIALSFFFCGSHCVSTCLDRIVSHPPHPPHSPVLDLACSRGCGGAALSCRVYFLSSSVDRLFCSHPLIVSVAVSPCFTALITSTSG
jgi:hypothetical protein